MLGYFNFSRLNNEYLITQDAGAYCFLTDQQFNDFIKGNLPHDSEKYKELEAKLFCYDGSRENYIRKTEAEVREGNQYLFEPTSLFIFAVTNACNNRCIYCQANGEKKNCHMEKDVAEQALKRIAECPAGKITIEFQGGEPLLNFSIIKYIVERAKVILAHKNVQFTLVSNLSLLTPLMADFFKNNRVSVSTSLDGPMIIHDRNRPSLNEASSFEAMLRGKKILESRGIIVGAIETTTAYSLSYAKEIVDTYIKYGFRQIFIRPLTRLGAAARAWDQIGYTVEQYLDFYKQALKWILIRNQEGNHLTEYHAAIFLSKILRGKAVNYMELRSPCGAGLGQMAFTANGNVYTCDEGRMMAEMGDEAFLLGNVFESDYNNWIESPNCKATCSASLLETLPGCCDCVYKPYCGVCPVINYALNGNITEISKDRCKIYQGMLDTLFRAIREDDPIVMKIFNEWSEQT